MHALAVRDLRSPVDVAALAALPAGTMLQWRDPVASQELAAIERWAYARPDARIRLYGRAVAQIDTLGPWPLASLQIECTRLPAVHARFERVHDLGLEGAPENLARLLGAFPALQRLRIAGRGGTVAAGALAAAPGLRWLAVSNTTLSDAHRLAASSRLEVLELHAAAAPGLQATLHHPGLLALRLSEMDGVTSLEGLRDGGLRVLSLRRLLYLETLAPLAGLARLESLELGELWQFDLAELRFLDAMPALRRLTVDIGGRRKNVEVYKRMPMDRALPFPAAVQDLKIR
jgi:hypothetical protein